jgi:hypothetical protein
MWTAVLHGKTAGESVVHSNAVVESHFRTLKHGTLGKKRNLRPGEIIMNEVTYLKSKLNEIILKNSSSEQPKQKPTKQTPRARTLDNAEEKWKRRNIRRGRYSDIPTARTRLFGNSSTAEKCR